MQYDSDWNELQYLVVTRETAFELQFLEKFDVELLIGQVNNTVRAYVYVSFRIFSFICMCMVTHLIKDNSGLSL